MRLGLRDVVKANDNREAGSKSHLLQLDGRPSGNPINL